MKKEGILHLAKSNYAYAYDENTLHITLRTVKNNIDEVEIIYGDPFNWESGNWQKKIEKMKLKYQSDLFNYYFIEVKPSHLRCKYAFILKKDNIKYLYGAKKFENYEPNNLDLQNYFNYPYINPEDLAKSPIWIKDTIWYQIFIDRFYSTKKNKNWGKLPVNNNEIYGGNLKGVIKKLPYLADLGITGIYFTPIFESKTAHKYDTINYFKIDPAFGTNQDFKKLVNEAHKLNIKIMLDGVFNHSGYLHPFFQDLILNGEKSIYKNSFYVDKFPIINFSLDENNLPLNKNSNTKLNFKTFAYTPFMPKWNTHDLQTKKHLLKVVAYWIKNYNIDGWRLDVSNEIAHDFLREIKKTARNIKEDVFILGENWDSSLPWLNGDQLDSVMNYDLAYPLWQFLEHKINLNDFINQINNYLALTPKNAMENMFNLVDSHDTIRILKRLDDNKARAKLAYLFMFLSSGAPNIYYGGEVGLSGFEDPDNRRCMIWDEKNQDLDLFEFLKTLIVLRKKYPSFKTYDYNFLSKDFLIFEKKFNDEKILVIINNSNDEINLTLANAQKGTYLDLFSNNINFYDKINLKGYNFKLLLRKDC